MALATVKEEQQFQQSDEGNKLARLRESAPGIWRRKFSGSRGSFQSRLKSAENVRF